MQTFFTFLLLFRQMPFPARPARQVIHRKTGIPLSSRPGGAFFLPRNIANTASVMQNSPFAAPCPLPAIPLCVKGLIQQKKRCARPLGRAASGQTRKSARDVYHRTLKRDLARKSKTPSPSRGVNRGASSVIAMSYSHAFSGALFLCSFAASLPSFFL